MNRKHCGKMRKCWLPAFSPFPTIFSKAFFSRGVKSRNCVVMVKILVLNATAKSIDQRQAAPAGAS